MPSGLLDEKAIFNIARQIGSPDARADYLRQACGTDSGLRERVDVLLRAYEEQASFLESPPPAGVAPTIDQPASETPGTVIGSYKLIEPIGEGGMGAVWMAQQTEPVKRLVALKLIKPGMDSKLVIARFEAERQALALMDHPNIARVLDAGTTGAGRPFFVMDLVKGAPITKYCDEHHLTPRQRLELFLPVCQAVQHAHQKGVIHRDLKPSNVLVALYDGKPVPKVIDFGVAKAAGQSLTDKTLVTGFGNIVGTLEYMSPEQAEINQLDIDTRSDIYSLGVLLYELLTGSPPFSRRELEQAGMLEMLRVIREQEPSKPSTKLSTSDALPTLSANRGLEPARLTKLVRGDLDWIVMKALEKDRNRRYETASAFATDVQRYLADEPVQAGPPSAWYRFKKFARRYRRGLIATVAFVLLLLSAVVTLAVALVAVNQERRDKEAALRAEANRRQQTRAALDAMTSDIIENWLTRQTVLLPEHRRFLKQALRSYEEFAADTGHDEESRAGVANAYGRIASIRNQLGQYREAEAAWIRSRELYAALAVDSPGVTDYRLKQAQTDISMGTLYRESHRNTEAESVLNRGRILYRQLSSENPDEPRFRMGEAVALDHLGITLKNLGRPPESEAQFHDALAILKPLADNFSDQADYSAQLALVHYNFGLLLDSTTGRSKAAISDNPGRPLEALEEFKKAAAIYRRLSNGFRLVPQYRDLLAKSLNAQANVLRDLDRPEAEDVFREAISIHLQLVADYHVVPVYRQDLAISLNNLAILLKNKGRLKEAEEYYRQSLEIHKRLATDHPEISRHQNNVAGAMGNLARLHLIRKDFEGARRLYEDALPYHRAALKDNERHPAYRNFFRINRWRSAEAYLGLKDHAAAAAAALEFLGVNYEPGRDAYTAATLLADCVRLSAHDERLTESRRKEVSATYGTNAVAALRQAIDKKAREATQIPKDPSLDPLRRRADFQKLLSEWEAMK